MTEISATSRSAGSCRARTVAVARSAADTFSKRMRSGREISAPTAAQEWTVIAMRLIDADALSDYLDDDPPYNRTGSDAEIQAEADWEQFRGIINVQPTVDAVPVVRCKDCRDYDMASGFCRRHSQYYDSGMSWDIFREDDFCSYGKRKGGERCRMSFPLSVLR